MGKLTDKIEKIRELNPKEEVVSELVREKGALELKFENNLFIHNKDVQEKYHLTIEKLKVADASGGDTSAYDTLIRDLYLAARDYETKLTQILYKFHVKNL